MQPKESEALSVVRLCIEGLLSILVLCGAGYALMHGATDGFEALCLTSVTLVIAFWFQSSLVSKVSQAFLGQAAAQMSAVVPAAVTAAATLTPGSLAAKQQGVAGK